MRKLFELTRVEDEVFYHLSEVYWAFSNRPEKAMYIGGLLSNEAVQRVHWWPTYPSGVHCNVYLCVNFVNIAAWNHEHTS